MDSGEGFGQRFGVLSRLGEGGMGIVYRALDRDRNEEVALKTLKTLSADGVLRFKQEFRALQDIHHPNLVQLHELIEERGCWFFTMDFVEGSNFLDSVWIREAKVVSSNTSDADTRT